MIRKQIENYLKQHNKKQIDIIVNESDEMAIYCYLQGGYLVDYMGHRMSRTQDFWGYYIWKDGKPIRTKWQEN